MDGLRLEGQPDLLADGCFACGMDQPFMSGFVITHNLVVHAPEQLGIHAHAQLALFKRRNLQVLGTDNDLHRFIAS
ncbi:hypothetical protein D3C86_2148290 [compost metagenome]